ncbi:MAG: alpha/beta hydrolase [Pseudomonadota bacterium]|nr:alpha/beta hydrolase [Pseudomonadota bacterium]
MLYQSLIERAQPLEYALDWGCLRGLGWGNVDKPRYILLHGWLDNCHSFLPLIEQLHESDDGIIALDWAGHGYSDHRPTGNYYHFTDYAYDIWQLIKIQEWSGVTFIGHSMGGFVGNMVTTLLPKHVSHLVLIEAFGLLTSDEENAHQQLLAGFQSRKKSQMAQWRPYTDKSQAVAARAKTADFSDALVEIIVERGIKLMADGHWYWRADPKVRSTSPYRLSSQAVEQILNQLRVPVVLVKGRDGYAQLDNALARWQDCVPQLRVLELGGGHHVHMQSPSDIAGIVREVSSS